MKMSKVEDLALSVVLKNWKVDQTFRGVLAEGNPDTERGIIFQNWTAYQVSTLCTMIREAIDVALIEKVDKK